MPGRSGARRAPLAAGLLLGGLAVLPLGAGTSAAGAANAPSGRSPISVSLSAPQSVESGERATFGAAVSAVDTRLAVAGATVVLDQRKSRKSGWREADRSVTDTRGRVALTVRVPSTREFRARALANAFFDGASSGILRVRVR